MSSNDNRRPEGQLGNGGRDYESRNTATVIPFGRNDNVGSPFGRLTARLAVDGVLRGAIPRSTADRLEGSRWLRGAYP
jgi:hypothetical protein